ncbi:hypothetical protein V5O48_011620 [Marasmius crinis-equi]|uniref:Uncharacterized protein n=1 Tax=Marasmius crinis-equi TaxID=585013 RepID=A0ABR3F534_9AGAR
MLHWLRALAGQVKAYPEIILTPDSRSPPVRDLVDGWADFCLENDQIMKDLEFSREVDNVYHTILSVFPNRDQLIAQLTSVLLLSSHTRPHHLHANDMLIGYASGGVLSTLKLMQSCRLAKSRDQDAMCPFLEPSLIAFLTDANRAGEFFVEKDTQHDSMALRWIATLTQQVKENPKIVLSPISRTGCLDALTYGWAGFCLRDGKLRTDWEYSHGLSNLYHSILSVFPDRGPLIASLASVILLPAHTCRPNLHFHDILLGLPRGYVLSVARLLHSCRLVFQKPRQNGRWGVGWVPGVPFELDPSFVDFLRDPARSGEFCIGDAQHRSLALRWIRVLAEKLKETPRLNPDPWSGPYRDLVMGWHAFCLQDDRFDSDSEFTLELDNLYLSILSAFPDRNKLAAVLAAAITLGGLEATMPEDRDSEIRLLWLYRLAEPLRDFSYILTPSFVNFLLDSTRSREYHINTGSTA